MSAWSTAARPPWGRAGLLGAGVVALLLPLAARRAEQPLHFTLLAAAIVALVALAVCDATTMLLPNRIMYPAIGAALLAAGLWPDHSFQASIAGGLAGFGVMLAFFIILPGFGAGDVKLCGLIGLIVGWPALWPALVAGVLCNGLIVAAGLATGRLRLHGAMPYGPGLIAGALLALLHGR